MKKRIPIITITIIIILGILILFFSGVQIFSPGINLDELEDCNLLEWSGRDKQSIVFFSDQATAKSYKDFLIQSSPYNKHKKEFNFFYIDDYIPECEIYKGIAILCYSKELIKRASSCPNDQIVIIKEDLAGIRSSAYMNVISINSNHPKTVFLHEFGHTFANLADEYVPSKIPKGSKNCPEQCESFGQFNTDCHLGCSDNEHVRSIFNGVMRTLATNDYGDFNEEIIKAKIEKRSPSITGLVIKNIVNCTKEEYVLIEGSYSNNQIEIINKDITTGCIGTNGAGIFSYKINKIKGPPLQGDEFNPELIFTDNEQGGEAIENEGNFFLKIPYIDNSESLEILSQGQTISQVNLLDVDSRPCPK